MTLFRGVIENNISPAKDGRVQVRIFGLHEDNKETIKTEHLPWAEVMQSTMFGFSSGVGISSVPNIGTWVFVILDNDNPNMPIVIGAISGKSIDESNPSLGFNSPDKIFPLKDRLNEEDQNRLQRVENLDKTIHNSINNNTTPSSDYFDINIKSNSDKSTYPDNTVIETKSNHVIEIDDTIDWEKIRIYHKSGTYIDFRPDGSIINKIKKDSICIIDGNKLNHIDGLFELNAEGNISFKGDLIVNGSIEVTGQISAKEDISSGSEVADKNGNLSSLRNVYDKHTHICTSLGGPTLIPTTTDMLIRWGDFTWSAKPK